MATWASIDGEIAATVNTQNDRLLETYRADPKRLEEDANTERSIHEGAYSQRQLYELLQNAADAMRESQGGRCEVLLTDHTLYVANRGAPLTVHGVETLMAAHLSAKRDDQIGRFGLGFKSVLAVTDSPQIYSRSGSLGFDRARSRQRLERAIPGRPDYPVARLAEVLDPGEAGRADPVLDSLMKWATTIVVLPHLTKRQHIADSIRTFPAEFLLFSQHVNQLDLEDRLATGSSRRITMQRNDDGLFALDNAGKKSKWAVTSRTHIPSVEALREGGYQAARESVDISWAAPVEGVSQRVGLFWAYFPTSEFTTLSGIVNAPWKLADDRERLLAGTFNDELLTEVLPGLVSATLPALTTPERPCVAIDALPARGQESRGHADDVINQPIYEVASKNQCIPNMAGELRHPRMVKLHPDKVTTEELELWKGACQDPGSWVSHEVFSNERRSKVLRLFNFHQKTAVGVKEWVEHIAKAGVEGSAAAVRIVASMVQRDPALRDQLRLARILLLEDGTLDAPRRGQVFMPGGATKPGQLIIDRVLAADPAVEQALHVLGIEIFDDAGELRGELGREPIDWTRVWSSSRRLDPHDAEEIFRDVFRNDDELAAGLRVRTFSGKWKSPGQVFLPGEIIPADGTRDVDFVVDHRFHQQDLGLLDALGLVDQPRRLVDPPAEPWRTASAEDVRQQYRARTQQPRLQEASVEIDRRPVLWPMEYLPELSDEGKHAVTRVALRALDGTEVWRLARGGSGQRFSVPDPVWFRLAKYGVLRTGAGIQPISACLVRPGDDMGAEDLACLPYVEESLTDQQADALHIKDAPEDLSPEAWAALLGKATGWEALRRFQLYAWAAFCDVKPPERIKVSKGRGHVEVAPTKAAVTAREDTYGSLLEADIPVVKTLTTDDAETLVAQWGLDVGEEMLTEKVVPDISGEPYVALDRFPPLRNSLDIDWHGLEIQPCNSIELLTSTPNGQTSRHLISRLDGSRLLTTAGEDRDVLAVIARETGTGFRPDAILSRMEKQRLEQLRVQIRDTEDVLEKLILAIGVDDLKSSIPAAAIDALTGSLDRELEPLEVARLARSVDGFGVLQKHRQQLEINRLDPPSQWAGRNTARSWVRNLGFPPEFAGFAGSTREAEIEIEGPPSLGELHQYQMSIGHKIKQLFLATGESNRGLVSLPTGSGKTRVAVQAIVEHMKQTRGNCKVLWIAETDELCEQAVQSWSLVWRMLGRKGRPLTLSRLWGSNEPEERDGYQVVVASIAKISSILRRNGGDWTTAYGWLQEPDMIVVDEAHRSIGSEYSDMLRAVGAVNRSQDIRVPLLGLTATPFRGFNKDETQRLINRYRTRLDEGIFPDDDAYGYLQDLGVLAKVDQIELTGTEITLTDDELSDSDKFKRLSPSVTDRLGQDRTRNNTIVESLLQQGASKVLLFATSVENARVLAALLSYHGVEARAVDAETSNAARRQNVEDFKQGRVRVLTNYNVFTEGFDVPAVDAVYITRPTFSPNVYQQMVGRGLRGPLNGGSEHVRIVNIADNFTNYGEEFAFRHFEHLWTERGQS
ncbi:DEAD/DEAH box helicase [Flexivirga oryzae]|uniref:Superfamily II DNA or RNA helicase n=1 Tax=Flexivirga oryzae TaxID=1794944 RepID=A0A839N7E4_9MICO|nr:DEAD/DEAH box helicase [Flexivirga oryzae]MBB2890661.1 superfamily II DNA or RNA helicase [Flexivirga oryzae]